ncbi:hypothetical protein C8R43DRAFT_662107 [Mycena crocata]|nr:hypothetical protein C8R43DRAFT_662107 [Mycena crocata]
MEVRAAPSTRSLARHSLRTVNAGASPSSLPVFETSSSREVSPTPALASRMPSADLNQGPSPPRSRSASQRMQIPVEQLPRQPVDRSPRSQRSISPLDWGSPKSTALSVEPVEDSSWSQIFAQQSQNSQSPPSLFSPESRLESVEPNDRHTSPEHEVQNSPLYTRRPLRRFRLFQSRPVSMGEGQLGKGVSAGVQDAATHGFDAEVVQQVFEASRNHEMGERILFRMRQAAGAVRQAALDEIERGAKM